METGLSDLTTINTSRWRPAGRFINNMNIHNRPNSSSSVREWRRCCFIPIPLGKYVKAGSEMLRSRRDIRTNTKQQLACPIPSPQVKPFISSFWHRRDRIHGERHHEQGGQRGVQETSPRTDSPAACSSTRPMTMLSECSPDFR